MLLAMTNQHERRRLAALILAFSVASLGAAEARASDSAAPVFGLAALGSNSGAGLSADAGLRFAGGQQLGIALASEGLWTAHLGGQVAKGVSASEARAFTLLPLLTARNLELDLRLGEGTGGVLATPLLRAAARLLSEVASLEDVISGRL